MYRLSAVFIYVKNELKKPLERSKKKESRSSLFLNFV